jgi:hypothetical protein
LSEYKSFLHQNWELHYRYLWDRFEKATAIFWENGSEFWYHRLTFLANLGEKSLWKRISVWMETKVVNLFRQKDHPSIIYDVEYRQFVELCKVKRARREGLTSIKNKLISLVQQISFDVLLDLIKTTVPYVFISLDEYMEHISRNIVESTANLRFLIYMEASGIPLNREPLQKLTIDLITTRAMIERHCSILFQLISDDQIRAWLKDNYQPIYHKRLILILESCNYYTLEDFHFLYLKNLLDLDASLGDSIIEIYGNKLYQRHCRIKYYVDKLIRLTKVCPQITPKKVLAFMSHYNHIVDIKYMISVFPELQKLAAFV